MTKMLIVIIICICLQNMHASRLEKVNTIILKNYRASNAIASKFDHEEVKKNYFYYTF